MKLLIRFLGLVFAVYLVIGLLQRIFGSHHQSWYSPVVIFRENLLALVTAGFLFLDPRKRRPRGEALVYVAGLTAMAVWYSINLAWFLRMLVGMALRGPALSYLGLSALEVFVIWGTAWLALTHQKFASSR